MTPGGVRGGQAPAADKHREGKGLSEILVEVHRGSLVESIHRGDIVVAEPEGRIIAYTGDPQKVTYWRSSAKPIQVLPLVENGGIERFGFTQSELAIMCASHSGEDHHLAAVRSILRKIGLGEDALQCGTHYPYYEPCAHRLIAAAQNPREVHCNCSGKHAGMLALAVLKGFSTVGYWHPDHPVQQLMLDTIAETAGIRRDEIILGTDGCGVPVHGLSLYHMALIYARAASGRCLSPARRESTRRIIEAMQAHPEMVAGTGRLCTILMGAGASLWAKAGAEAVYCLGHVTHGYGFALKIEDGSSRAVAPSVLEALSQLGDLPKDPGLEALWHPEVKNHRKESVGRVQPAFRLKFDRCSMAAGR